MQVINPTPFPAIAWPTVNVEDTNCITLLARTKMLLDRMDENGVWSLSFDPEQGELFEQDTYEESDPARVRYESDYIPYKPQGDLIIHLPEEADEHRWCTLDVVRNGEDDAPTSQTLIHASVSGSPGVVPRTDVSRLALTGTADEAWIAERAPLYPRDFDEHYHNAAPRALQLPHAYFQPGDAIYFRPCDHEKLSESVVIPGVYLSARIETENGQEVVSLDGDTVIIERDGYGEEDSGQMYISYRRRVPISGTPQRVTFDLMLEPSLMAENDTTGANHG